MKDRLTDIKVSNKTITEAEFEFKMSKIPDFFWIKIHKDKLYYRELSIYISKEDADGLGFQNIVNITNEFNDIFNRDMYV